MDVVKVVEAPPLSPATHPAIVDAREAAAIECRGAHRP